MCIHPEIVRLTTGWYCPDCGETFEERPKPTKITFLNTEESEKSRGVSEEETEKPVEVPKPKRTRKPKDTKAE